MVVVKDLTNVHIQRKLSWALVLTWVSPFVEDLKVGFGLGEEYDISRVVEFVK